MLKPLATAALIACMTPCTSLGAAYTLSAFTADCRQSGGVPRLYDQSVVCEDQTHADIVCLRVQAEVHGCALTPSNMSSSQPPSG